MRRRVLAAILALCWVVLFPVLSFAQEWLVHRVSQPAYFTVDSETWKPLSKGMALPQQSWIHTGRRGKIKSQAGCAATCTTDNQTTCADETATRQACSDNEMERANGQ